MDDLVKWLAHQILLDEAGAQLAAWGWEAVEEAAQVRRSGDPVDTAKADAVYQHVTAFGPLRVVAEVEAKRAHLAEHGHFRFDGTEPGWPQHVVDQLKAAFPGDARPYVGCMTCACNSDYQEVQPDWWCNYVRVDAAVYADRPGYRTEWAPNEPVVDLDGSIG